MIADTMPSLTEQIDRALSDGKLRADAAENIRRILSGEESDFAARVICELSQANEWEELNDRFYKTLAFGTGGLRGRTIGKIVTPSERGTPTALGRPEFPCVGTNAMNYFNVGRATRGLIVYIQKWRSGQRMEGQAKIVIAHDTRHFSQEFTRLAAETASANGCDAVVFDGPRSTPELSFAVRYLNADAGIVITASHNPLHDNGYKVYFNDGAQVVEPHASGIIAEVNEPNGGTGSVPSQKVSDDTEVVPPKGEIIFTGDEIDRAYMERLETLILDRGLIERTRDLKIVYTPIHGTGGVIVKPMLRKIDLNFSVVPEQDQFDGRFPTVKSPNPENAEALNLGISLAQKQNADLVVATDPDCDRMGVAVRTSSGEMKLLSGNQIGSLLAWYRAKTFFDRGILNKENAGRGVIMFCEVAAYAKSRGLTLDELLDQVFCEFGYFEERNHSIYFEGADGAEKIRRLLISYDENPPRQVLDSAVTRAQNFEKDTILDSDGDEIPKEKMLIFELADKTRVAVRGSGTEPKIKYYLFGARLPADAKLSREELTRAKTEIGNRLDALWDWLEKDAKQRLAK